MIGNSFAVLCDSTFYCVTGVFQLKNKKDLPVDERSHYSTGIYFSPLPKII